jgi:2-iminoacetate synthase ThiH
VTVETRDRPHAEEIFKALKAEGFQPVWNPTGAEVQ